MCFVKGGKGSGKLRNFLFWEPKIKKKNKNFFFKKFKCYKNKNRGKGGVWNVKKKRGGGGGREV